MWFVYALYNLDNDKIYVGETSNLDRRLEEHNQKRGNHYTAKISGSWSIIYNEEVVDRNQALVREKQLKSHKGRDFVKQFIPVESYAPR